MNNITRIGEMVAQAVQEQLTKEDKTITLTALEQTTRQILQQVGQQALTHLLDQAGEYPDSEITCTCGQRMPYVRRRQGTFHTLFGSVQIKRAYYLCDSCNTGQFPLDKQLGLYPNQLSAEVTRLAAMTGVQLPFQTGSDLFTALTLVPISDQAMSKATRSVGQIVAQQETIAQAATKEPEEMLRRQRDEKRPLRLYGSIDATKVHIRDGGEHRWRDLKVGAWYEASGCPPTSPDGQWRIKASSIDYYADIAPAADFGDLFWATGVQRQAQLAGELILIGDGAEWIWNIAAAHFPAAIQILDWFHASEHLMPVAQSIFSSVDEQQQWVRQKRDLLWEGQVAEVIATCRCLHQKYKHDICRLTANYFETHQQRMRYAHFRAQGYQIGSGTIESAAKQIGMMRMKVPGAIWNEENARHVAKARAAYLSNRWDDLPLAA